ncbi:MAG: DUF192 domain-containing protein [Candidatus Omnitrophota bacterium]
MGEKVVIYNVSKTTILAKEAVIAASLAQRMQGLLGRVAFLANEGLILQPCSSIHTFFMRFPIDVLFLDKHKRVVKQIQNLPPFRVSPIVWTSCLAIELPAGTINQTNTQKNDIIEIRPQA